VGETGLGDETGGLAKDCFCIGPVYGEGHSSLYRDIQLNQIVIGM